VSPPPSPRGPSYDTAATISVDTIPPSTSRKAGICHPRHHDGWHAGLWQMRSYARLSAASSLVLADGPPRPTAQQELAQASVREVPSSAERALGSGPKAPTEEQHPFFSRPAGPCAPKIPRLGHCDAPKRSIVSTLEASFTGCRSRSGDCSTSFEAIGHGNRHHCRCIERTRLNQVTSNRSDRRGSHLTVLKASSIRDVDLPTAACTTWSARACL
jgi:hypothetical protein